MRNTLLGSAMMAGAIYGCPGGSECDPSGGKICTLVGVPGVAGLSDDGLLPDETELYLPQDITVGPNGLLYIVDWNNHRIRKIDNDGLVQTVVGTGYIGDAQSAPADEVNLNHPTHLAFDATGDMIISAWHNSKVLRYNDRASSNTVETICGTGMRAFNGDGMPGTMTAFDLPVATAIEDDGSILISDQANQRVRRLKGDGTVETVVGIGMQGYGGDGGPAIDAMINLPVSQSAPPAGRIALDSDGTLYIADTMNHVVRRVDKNGIIETFAGTGEAGNGDSADATATGLDTPSDIAIDDDSNIYIADTMNSCIRRVTPESEISTAAGICGEQGFDGDKGLATEALLDRPYGVEWDDGKLYVADTHNHVIRVVDLEL